MKRWHSDFGDRPNGTSDSVSSFVQDMCLNHGRADIFMAEEFLDESLDPMAIGLLGAAAVMTGTQRLAELVKKLWLVSMS